MRLAPLVCHCGGRVLTDLAMDGSDTGIMIQDISPTGRSQILAQLPDGVIRQIAAVHGGVLQVVADCPVELATYSGLAESPKLAEAVQHTIGSIVRRSSWSQVLAASNIVHVWPCVS